MSLPVVLEPGAPWGTRFTTYRAALAAAQKPGAGVPAYMRWVNRGAARVAAAACAAFGWTPNFVSFISVCFSTLGLIVLVALEPAWWTGLIVGTSLAVGFMFDSADGQVSRVTGASSKTGEWVDHVADAFRSPAIHFCTAAAVMVYRPESWWLAIVALVYGWVTSGQFMSQILAEQFVR
ncbi:CDP-alcohol phosphatidyltransferase family protein, partial [uncultured Actinomyces sp.]|uniref:CDP-alcohol phosphatidyltransferase family protein n=1 Tax=uncultured Actinomyces sp. TaxID=249061 RepID=UPI002613235F